MVVYCEDTTQCRSTAGVLASANHSTHVRTHERTTCSLMSAHPMTGPLESIGWNRLRGDHHYYHHCEHGGFHYGTRCEMRGDPRSVYEGHEY